MKDLYTRLGLNSDARPEDIRSALDRGRGEGQDRTDAETVLLHPSRRAAYDRTRQTLRIIGILRAELQLPESALWTPELASDFYQRANEQASKRRVPRRKIPVAEVVTAALAIATVVLVVALETDTMDATTPTQPQTTHVAPEPSHAPAIKNTPSTGFAPVGWEDATALDVRGICEVQELLLRTGHYRALVDGKWGPKSEGALREFERDHGLSALGQPTRGRLSAVRQKTSSMSTHELWGRDGIRWELPPNGTVFKGVGYRAPAPFRVTTPLGTESYYVKLESVDGFGSKEFFAHAGSTVNTMMPLGAYTLKYATGAIFFGPECYFGRDTQYHAARETLRFRIIGNQIQGHEVTLIKQVGGNLDTGRIPAADF